MDINTYLICAYQRFLMIILLMVIVGYYIGRYW
jgi:hypothetical protein